MRPNLVRFPRFLALFLFLMFVPSAMWAGSKTIVISQVFGGGGNTGAPYEEDFVELFNLSNSPVNLSGYSVQYFSSGGTFGASITLPSFNLQPGQYYLVGGSVGSCKAPTCAALPTVDILSTLSLSGTDGQVFLAQDATRVTEDKTTCTLSSNIIDHVAFGSGVCGEGGTAAPVLTNKTAAIRKSACTDTDNNLNDFDSSQAPNPHNTSSTAAPCVAPVTLTPIHTIQGNKPGTSTFTGQSVNTSGIVTGIRSNGFYLQARDSAADSDPATPEGIFVFTGTGNVPASATLNTELQVTGTVAIFPTTSSDPTAARPETELTGPSGYTTLSTGNTPPAAISLTATLPNPTGAIDQLSHYQSMRVSIANFTTTQGTDGTFNEPNEQYTSNGVFWGTVTGVTRPVREPGLEILDPLTATQPNTIARFDDNPEVFQIDSLSMTGSPGPLDVTSNTALANVSGVMDLGTGYPVVVLDAATRPTVTGTMTATAVPSPASNELTVGELNMERFYNATADTTGETVLTSAAYTRRLQKASLAIRNIFLMPDVMAVEEVENVATLTDIAKQISTDALAASQTDPLYMPYLIQGTDGTAISSGFLVKKSKVNVIKVEQFGLTDTFPQAGGTGQEILNDRPPLVLHASITRPGASDYPLTVIVNHLKSLNGATASSNSGQNVRTKREMQAEYLAKLIQGYQSGGEHVISVGDYNAFDVNDGLVDSMDIIRGAATSASQDVLAGPASPLVTPALVDVFPTNVGTGAYSYVYKGNAQSIDHILVTSDIASNIHVSAAHLNADFPVIDRNDATTPLRTSDHDGLVAYLAIPGISLTLNPTALTFDPLVVGQSATKTVAVSNAGKTAIAITSIIASTGFTQTNTCGSSLGAGANCTISVTFAPTGGSAVTGTLVLTDSDITGTQTISLTATGIASVANITLTVFPTNLVAGTNVQMTATLTGNSTNGPSGTVTFLDGSTSLGTGTITGGTATFSTTKLAVGSHTITASYGSDSVYPKSTSTPTTVIVSAPPVPDFTLSVANTQVILTNGQPSATTAVDVAMVNGFSSAVSFTCNNLPAAVRCTFTPATLSASGESTLTLTKNASATLGEGPLGFGKTGGIALAALGLPLLLTGFRKRMCGMGAVLGMLLLALGMASLTGCGNGTTTAPGTATVTITGTGGSVTHGASFTLTIQ